MEPSFFCEGAFYGRTGRVFVTRQQTLTIAGVDVVLGKNELGNEFLRVVVAENSGQSSVREHDLPIFQQGAANAGSSGIEQGPEILFALSKRLILVQKVQLCAGHGGNGIQHFQIFLAKAARFRIFTIDHPDDFVADDQRHADLGPRFHEIPDVPLVTLQVIDDDRLSGFGHMTRYALADRYLQDVGNGNARRVFIADCRHLPKQLPFGIDQIDHAIVETEPADHFLCDIPDKVGFRGNPDQVDGKAVKNLEPGILLRRRRLGPGRRCAGLTVRTHTTPIP